MAAKTITKEQLKGVLQLADEGLAVKQIARLTGLERNTVKSYLARAQANDLPPLIHNDAELAAIMFNNDEAHCTSPR